jgi:hypothetical protein
MEALRRRTGSNLILCISAPVILFTAIKFLVFGVEAGLFELFALGWICAESLDLVIDKIGSQHYVGWMVAQLITPIAFMVTSLLSLLIGCVWPAGATNQIVQVVIFVVTLIVTVAAIMFDWCKIAHPGYYDDLAYKKL